MIHVHMVGGLLGAFCVGVLYSRALVLLPQRAPGWRRRVGVCVVVFLLNLPNWVLLVKDL